ncbi:ATP-binding protein [Actinophytocola sediminis]
MTIGIDDDRSGCAGPVVTNGLAGTVSGPVVQAGVIYGDVRFGAAESWVPSVLRQLPPVAAHFTNRVAELAVLDEAAAVSGAAGLAGLAVLTGPGGVGKTALAVAWAARNADRYPDGQLYADLQGYSTEGAVHPEVILGRFLRALGLAPDRVPVELSEQATMFRSMTAGKRLVLVLDNALSAAQVRVLLPASARCMVVVTSRVRLEGLNGDGSRFVEVAPLPSTQAVELLSRSIGRQRAADQSSELRELASLCGGLPIALSVAGARLAARPRWAVARVVAELTDERQRLARLSSRGEVSVSAAFDLSYQTLPGGVARLYRLASEHPGPDFAAGVAAAAALTSEDEAEDGLQELVDVNLLEEIGPDRYRFHDLVRLHARAHADGEREAARRRIGDWFLHRMTRANMMVIPIRWRVATVCEQYRDAPALFASRQEAVEWLDAQLPNVLAVLTDAAQRGWDELAWQVCEALWELFVFRRHYREWIASHAVGIEAARRCGNAVAESRLRCQLGRAYLDLGRFDEARHESEHARVLAGQASDRRNESVALQQLGLAAEGLGDIEGALEYLTRSLLIEQELGIDRGVALRHRRIGEVLLGAGRDAEAAAHLEQARVVFAAQSDPRDEAQVLISLARVDSRAGHRDQAESRLAQALEVLSGLGSAIFHADVLIAYGEISHDHGDLDSARRYLSEALVLCRDLDGPQQERIHARLAALDQATSG